MNTGKTNMSNTEKWALLAGVMLTGFMVYLLAPVLTPFLAAALLAYLGDPVVDRLEEKKFSRTLAVVTVFIGLFTVILAIFLFIVPLLNQQLVALIKKIPEYINVVQGSVLPWLSAQLGLDPETFDAGRIKAVVTEQWQAAGAVVTDILGSMFHSGMAALTWVMNLVLIPVVTFYLLRDWDVLVGRVHELTPRRFEPSVVKLAKSSDEVLGAFLRGQMMVMLALGVIYATGLWLVGLEFALLIGLLAGVLCFVPYLGLIVGILVAGIAAFLQFHDIQHVLLVMVVFVAGQLLEGMVLTPKLVGDKIGLHPVAVIFAVLAGGQLFGFIGILLALPVAAIIMVLLRFAHEHYLQSQLYAE
jgi:predicted PurR-regulated permease PerM